MMQRSVGWAVLVGGSIAGLLDILFAFAWSGYNGLSPPRVLQTVASGLVGIAAFDGGNPAAALGLGLHFFMSLVWAAIFVMLAKRVPLIVARPVPFGIAFGVLVFLTMRLVVLPLSAFPGPVSFKPLGTVLDLLSHTLLFGVPIALAACRAATPQR